MKFNWKGSLLIELCGTISKDFFLNSMNIALEYWLLNCISGMVQVYQLWITYISVTLLVPHQSWHTPNWHLQQSQDSIPKTRGFSITCMGRRSRLEFEFCGWYIGIFKSSENNQRSTCRWSLDSSKWSKNTENWGRLLTNSLCELSR